MAEGAIAPQVASVQSTSPMGLSAFIAPALMVNVLLKRAVADEDYAATFSMLTACFALGQILGPLLGLLKRLPRS